MTGPFLRLDDPRYLAHKRKRRFRRRLRITAQVALYCVAAFVVAVGLYGVARALATG